MDICNSCEFNSKNSPAKDLKDVAQDLLHMGSPFCRVCLCFIDRKAAMKEEQCGLAEKGLPPKWDALAILTRDSKDWNIYNNSPEVVKVGFSEKYFILDYGAVTDISNPNVQIILESKVNKITRISASCGCTTPNYKDLGKGMYTIDIHLNFKSLGANFTKNVYVSYKNDEGVKGTLQIQLKGTKYEL